MQSVGGPNLTVMPRALPSTLNHGVFWLQRAGPGGGEKEAKRARDGDGSLGGAGPSVQPQREQKRVCPTS